MNHAPKFLTKLRRTAFSSDFGDDISSKLAGATDNSIHRMKPDAIPFDADVIADTVGLLQHVGFKVQAKPILPNGKSSQVCGFLRAFKQRLKAKNAVLDGMFSLYVPFISLVLAVTNLMQCDFKHVDMLNLDQFLKQKMDRIPPPKIATTMHVLHLHCTEKNPELETSQRWQKILKAMGIPLHLNKTSFYGKVALSGHETENQDMTRQLFNLFWQETLKAADALSTSFLSVPKPNAFPNTLRNTRFVRWPTI